MEIGQSLVFAAYYMECGNIQKTDGKDGLIIKTVEVTNYKNGLIFYRVDGEMGERKSNIKFLNQFRDFGTSIYGIFEQISGDEAIDGIVQKMNDRIDETTKAMSALSLIKKG